MLLYVVFPIILYYFFHTHIDGTLKHDGNTLMMDGIFGDNTFLIQNSNLKGF